MQPTRVGGGTLGRRDPTLALLGATLGCMMVAVLGLVAWRCGLLSSPAERAVARLMAEPFDESQSLDALARLERLGTPAIDSLVQELSRDERRRQILAADALGVFGPRGHAAVPRLVELLGSDDAAVRAAAADCLGSIGTASRPAVPVLVRVSSEDDHWWPRQAATKALTRIVPRHQNATSP